MKNAIPRRAFAGVSPFRLEIAGIGPPGRDREPGGGLPPASRRGLVAGGQLGLDLRERVPEPAAIASSPAPFSSA